MVFLLLQCETMECISCGTWSSLVATYLFWEYSAFDVCELYRPSHAPSSAGATHGAGHRLPVGSQQSASWWLVAG
eukprot:COSAG02_NODE_561_length_20308_cov_42.799495_18_plen_75_part_00